MQLIYETNIQLECFIIYNKYNLQKVLKNVHHFFNAWKRQNILHGYTHEKLLHFTPVKLRVWATLCLHWKYSHLVIVVISNNLTHLFNVQLSYPYMCNALFVFLIIRFVLIVSMNMYVQYLLYDRQWFQMNSVNKYYIIVLKTLTLVKLLL